MRFFALQLPSYENWLTVTKPRTWRLMLHLYETSSRFDSGYQEEAYATRGSNAGLRWSVHTHVVTAEA